MCVVGLRQLCSMPFLQLSSGTAQGVVEDRFCSRPLISQGRLLARFLEASIDRVVRARTQFFRDTLHLVVSSV